MKRFIHPKDPRYIFLQGSPKEMNGLTKHLNKVPLYQLLPSYHGQISPEVFLDEIPGKDAYYCSSGLWREVDEWCQEKRFSIDPMPKDAKYTKFDISKEDFRTLVLSWGLTPTPRDYQIDAAWMILKYKYSLSELATRAGKTLIFYIVSRAAMELLGVKKILMIVPSIHLVRQGVEDLEGYQEFFKTEQVWAGGESVSTANLTIGTFQSLVLRADPRSKKYDPDYFSGFDLVCVDECHKLPCRSIRTILANPHFRDVKLRFGFTGTLPKRNTIEWFSCQALMGPKIQTIEARELIDEGYLAEPVIHQIRLSYTDDYTAHVIRCAEYLVSNYVMEGGSKALLPKELREGTMIYKKTLPVAVQQSKDLLPQEGYMNFLIDLCKDASQALVLEQMVAQRSWGKLQALREILQGTEKNVIVFAHNTEYIKYIADEIADIKKVFTITGSKTLKNRQKVVDQLAEQDGCVLIGSYGCVGTGLTFKNIHSGVFLQSFKSDIITRQSLGRLMLRQEGKTEFDLYDIIDIFPTKKIYSQGLQKIRSYEEQGFSHTVDTRKVLFNKQNTLSL